MSTRYVWQKYTVSSVPATQYISQNIACGNYMVPNPTIGGQTGVISGNNFIGTGSWSCTAPNGYSGGAGTCTSDGRTYTSFTISWSLDPSGDYYCAYITGYQFLGYSNNVAGSSLGNVSSGSSNSYPTNDQSGSYWYIYKGSDNIDPTSINYPTEIKIGDSIILTANASSGNTYGGTIAYTWEVQLNGGSWTSIGSTTTLTKSYIVPANTTTFSARVKASDNMGFASTTYATGNQVTIINNSAPTISGSDKDLGSFSYQPPYIEYNVNDADGNLVSVSIQLDSQSIYSGTTILGRTNFIVFPDWNSLSSGSHTITITANDGQGGTAIRTYTFTKSIDVTEINKERWHRNNGHDVYDLVYLETNSNIVITNNGKNLSDRLTAIQSRIAALKG